MNIKYSNKEEIEKNNVHDACLEDFQYNIIEKQINFKLNNTFNKKNYYCIFRGVIYCEIIATELWGQVERIIDWELLEDYKKLKELKFIEKQDENNYINSLFRRKPNIDYITTVFTLNSGDTIIIIFEEVEIEEN